MWEQVDTIESLLLLYAADELPPAGRAGVERRLAEDASLREVLARLEADQAAFASAMAKLDGPATRAAGEASVARITRALRQHSASHHAPEATAPPRRLHLPSWAYPVAAAAVVLLGLLSYWAHSPLGTSKPLAINQPDNPADDAGQDAIDAEELELTFDQRATFGAASEAALNDAEQEVADTGGPSADVLRGAFPDPFSPDEVQ